MLRIGIGILAGLAAFAACPVAAQNTASTSETAGPSAGLPAKTADQIAEAARQSLNSPGTRQLCKAPEGNEIVVCAKPAEPDAGITTTQEDLDSQAAAAARTLCAGCVKRQGVGVRVGFGKPPPPIVFIDLKAIPEAPPGSDAARFKEGAEAPAKPSTAAPN